MERVFKRTGGRIWYGWFYENGHRIQRSTRRRSRSRRRAHRDAERRARPAPPRRYRGDRCWASQRGHARVPPQEGWPPGAPLRDERSGGARCVSARPPPTCGRGPLHLAAPRGGERGCDDRQGDRRAPEGPPSRHPRRSLARPGRGGHPPRLLSAVRAAEARADGSRARPPPRRASCSACCARRVHRRDLGELKRERARSARGRSPRWLGRLHPRDEAEDAPANCADRQPGAAVVARVRPEAHGRDG